MVCNEKQTKQKQKKEMKILHLTLNAKWFDMILLQLTKPELAKLEEYREIKNYFLSRFVEKDFAWSCYNLEDMKYHIAACPNGFWKKFDYIEFSNGYSKTSRKMIIEFKGFELGTGRTDWGAVEGVEYFKLKLGKITDTKNCNN